MNDLTIRNIDDRTVTELTLRAAASGRGIEDEARDILSTAVGGAGSGRTGRSLVEEIRAMVAPTGGFTLDIGEREPMREPPSFDR